MVAEPEAPCQTMREMEATPHIFQEALEEAAEAAAAGQASSQQAGQELPELVEQAAWGPEVLAAAPARLTQAAQAEMGNASCIISQRLRERCPSQAGLKSCLAWASLMTFLRQATDRKAQCQKWRQRFFDMSDWQCI